MFYRDTYKDRVKQYIIDLILNKKISPGDQVKEKDLSLHLGISRAPIREALRELIAEKILEYIPFKGTYLKKTSPKEALDIYITRGLLEGYAVADSISSNLKNMKRLTYFIENMYLAAKDRDHIKLIEFGHQFHNLLMKGCSNSLILTETNRLGLICHLLFFNFWTQIYTPDQIKYRHDKILNIIYTKDKGKLEAVIREHYFETGKKISTLIKRGGYGEDNIF
jgi:DNA-binding GntR family transcriptional regulator